MFIVIEGIDGAGKTTLVRKLANRLQDLGYKVLTGSFPTSGTIAELGRQHVRLGEPPWTAQMLFAVDKWQVLDWLEASQDGVLLVDRYILSGVAYGLAQGLDKVWLFSIHRYLPWPDLTVWLDVPVELAMASKGRDIFEDIAFQRRVRDSYKRLYDEGFIDLVVSRENAVEEILGAIRQNKEVSYVQHAG